MQEHDEGETAQPTLDDCCTTYSEDEVVGLINELYELLIKLAYLRRDHVTWPPDGGHFINEALCRELHLEPKVVSLMRCLPYIDGDFRYSIHLFPESEPLSYLQNDDLERSRDPHGDSWALRWDYILPCDIPLTAPGDEGPYLVLDVRESKSWVFTWVLRFKADVLVSDTIREVPWDKDPEDCNPNGWEPERPDDPRYYRNYYPQHAPTFLRRFIGRIKALEVIPSGCVQFERQYYGSQQPEIVSSIPALQAQPLGDTFPSALAGSC